MTTTPAPPGPGVDTLWLGTWLTDVLAAAAAVLGSDAPPRRYVSAGEPVPECNQLTVHISQLRPAGGGAGVQLTRPTLIPQASLEFVPVAEFQVTLWRCVHATVGDSNGRAVVPTSADLNADGVMMARLGQALWYGLVQASIDGTLWPLQNKPAVLWRSLAQVAPQAGIAAWKMTGEVSLT